MYSRTTQDLNLIKIARVDGTTCSTYSKQEWFAHVVNVLHEGCCSAICLRAEKMQEVRCFRTHRLHMCSQAFQMFYIMYMKACCLLISSSPEIKGYCCFQLQATQSVMVRLWRLLPVTGWCRWDPREQSALCCHQHKRPADLTLGQSMLVQEESQGLLQIVYLHCFMQLGGETHGL